MNNWISLAVVAPIVWCSSAFASRAYDEGAAEARADLDKGYAYAFGYGLMRAGGDNVAWSNGLPVRMIAGCIVDDAILDRAKGYNETVAAWTKEHGKPPANSIKPWEKELKDVVAYCNAAGAAPSVRVGAEPVRVLGDADEKHAVSVTAPNESGECYLVLKTDEGEVRHTIAADAAKHVVAKAGPAGSMTVAIRMPGREGEESFHLYELRRGALLIWNTAQMADK